MHSLSTYKSKRPVLSRRTVGAVAGATAAALGIAAARSAWSRGSARAVDKLRSAVQLPPPRPRRDYSQAALASLPPPVARFLKYAVPERFPIISAATIRWKGDFQSRRDGGWERFTAAQHYTTCPPGFVWDARIRMLPFLDVHVRDSYIARRGAMLARVGSIIPVVDQSGSPEMAQSALVRWLGEAPWFPTAFLPGGPVRWEPLDSVTARAVVKDGEIEATAEFEFEPDGPITRMTAMRYRDVAGNAVLTPFVGWYDRFERRAGVMVPRGAEVAWQLPEGQLSYWRGRVEAIAYDFLPS